MKKIAIINGPNLNMLGQRETDIYGVDTFEDYLRSISAHYDTIEIDYFHTNVEGEIVNALQGFSENTDGIILNAAGYSHTSVAILDAIRAIKTPVVEVHISNIHNREAYRKHSLTAEACLGCITGFGLDSYRLGIEALLTLE